MMSTIVTVSPKYQIVIPKEVREAFDIKPGQKLGILAYGGNIYIVPVRSIEEAQGMLPPMDTTVAREPDREL